VSPARTPNPSSARDDDADDTASPERAGGDSGYGFPPFRFDPGNATLWLGKRRRSLRPRAAALLQYLIEHAGDVATPEELLAALWPDVKVSPGILKVHVFEIRQALRDRKGIPKFVETVPRRGYRWIAPFTRLSSEALAPSPRRIASPAVFGREAELAALGQRLEAALAGERQVVFVTGEPGIGKTTLVDAFLAGVAARPDVRIARGQCIEHYGSGEPYLPVLSALGQLGRGSGRRPLATALRRHAPTWLDQLPSLQPRSELEPSARAAPRPSRDRMLRELAEALETMTARRGLTLVLEDLQWSDSSTLDLVSFLAQRPTRARLLVIATRRDELHSGGRSPGAAIEDLLARHPANELPLGLLGEADVIAYLRTRLPPRIPEEPLVELARAIHRRTEGNPLFLVNVVDDLLPSDGTKVDAALLAATAAKARRSVPPSLRQMIERRIDRLDAADQRLLEVASAAGAELSAATVAAALDAPVAVVEQSCSQLARSARFLAPAGTDEWVDGTVAARFAFVHSLYQSVLYDRLTPALRLQLHRRIAARLERGFGARAPTIAAELAVHLEQGREPVRAIQYLELAADNALAKNAPAEAAQHLRRALDLLKKKTPPSPERVKQELSLLVKLGAPLVMTSGYGAPDVVAIYARALELCPQVGDSLELLRALVGVYRFALVRSELGTTKDIGNQVLRLARRTGLSIASLAGHLMIGVTTFGLGAFTESRRHLEQALGLYDPELGRLIAMSFGDDPGVAGLSELATVLWFLGYPDQALARAEEALARAHESGVPYSLAFALNYLVWTRLLRREAALSREHADEQVDVAVENGFQHMIAQGTAVRGWVLADQGDVEEGIAQIRAGLDTYEKIGAHVVRPWHLCRLAEALAAAGRIDEARATLAEAFALMGEREEHFYEPELLRIRGEIALAADTERDAATKLGSVEQEAEKDFRRAIALSRRKRAKSLELRAALSLCRLWLRHGRSAAARKLLDPLYGWFREGFETGDLRAARALLAELHAAAKPARRSGAR
jgi:DNA-binding winged helix-turn-helix (wHTH) protein/predicted ATPase